MVETEGSTRTFSEQRLDEIATSTRQIAFWVRLWSVLLVSIAGLGVLLALLAAIAPSVSSISLPAGPNSVVYIALAVVVVVLIGLVALILWWGLEGRRHSAPRPSRSGGLTAVHGPLSRPQSVRSRPGRGIGSSGTPCGPAPGGHLKTSSTSRTEPVGSALAVQVSGVVLLDLGDEHAGERESLLRSPPWR